MADLVFLPAVGERIARVMIYSTKMKASGVLKNCAVFGQMNEPWASYAWVALTGLTIMEDFRDQSCQDVLLFIDNIFRFTQAGSWSIRTFTVCQVL